MTLNKLKLNTGKTELFYFHSKFPPHLQLHPIQLGSDVILPSSHARNIGVILTLHAMKMSRHINAVVKSAFYRFSSMHSYFQRLTITTRFIWSAKAAD